GLDPLDAHVVQRPRATGQHFFPGQRPDDQFQAHRVVVRRNGVAGVDRRIGAHAGTAGRVVAGDLAEAGQEVVAWLLGVDAELQGEAAILDIFLLDRQRQPRGNADLLADDVDAGDFLGDGVLDLHPGVHLHEVHLAIGEQELHGAGVLVAHRLGRLHRQIADVGALLGGQLRAGGDFDELLVAPLDGTVALEQVHGIAEAVGQNLRLDVLGLDDALLEKDVRRTEGLGRLGNHPRVGLFQLLARAPAPNATAAATGPRLEHDRIADALGLAQGFLDVLHVAFGARRDRHAGLHHPASSLGLVTHAADDFGAGANETDAALGTDFGQFVVLREKTIARVQGVAAGLDGQVDQFARVQVTRQRVVADEMRFVGTLDVQRMAIGLGEHRHRTYAHFGAGPHDTDGDFPAVGDQ